MVRAAIVAVALVAGLAGDARGQNVETDPLQCWWRTSAGAVRVEIGRASCRERV